MNAFSRIVVAFVLDLGVAGPPPARAQEDDESAVTTVTAEGDEINPRGRASDNLTNQSPRFFVWFDGDDWHLRSASTRRRLRKFTGTITVSGGKFDRLRAVGFERKGKHADTWKRSEDRTKVEFDIKTTHSFDGIDFSVSGSDAVVTFDLKIGGRSRPGKIFIGNKGQHPSKAEFSFPADP